MRPEVSPLVCRSTVANTSQSRRPGRFRTLSRRCYLPNPVPVSMSKRPARSGIGSRLREIREARGLTLASLARKSGIAKPNLSPLENDKVTPTFKTLQMIASALGTHPALFVREDAWEWTQYYFDQWRL